MSDKQAFVIERDWDTRGWRFSTSAGTAFVGDNDISEFIEAVVAMRTFATWLETETEISPDKPSRYDERQFVVERDCDVEGGGWWFETQYGNCFIPDKRMGPFTEAVKCAQAHSRNKEVGA